MLKEAIEKTEVPIPGWRVVDRKYEKAGVLGIEAYTPEAIARVENAIRAYMEDSRRMRFVPWTTEDIEEFNRQRERQRRNLILDSPI